MWLGCFNVKYCGIVQPEQSYYIMFARNPMVFSSQRRTRESFQPPRPVFYSLVDWRTAKPPGVASEAEKRSKIKGGGRFGGGWGGLGNFNSLSVSISYGELACWELALSIQTDPKLIKTSSIAPQPETHPPKPLLV